jgi:hypothetical protein
LSPLRALLSVCSAKWSPLGLMDVALDTIIVRIVVYRRESEKRSTVDATVSAKVGLVRNRCPSVLKKQRRHNGAGVLTHACFLVIWAALPPTSRQRSPCPCMKPSLQFAMAWAGRFLCQEGGEVRMTPGIKRLDHEVWLSLLALSVPIHDGKSHTTRMSASV